MHIVLDVDDTITLAPEFFARLTHALPDVRVTILTLRLNPASTARFVDELGVRYDEIVTADHSEMGRKPGQSLIDWKVEAVTALAPDIYFEDMPEVVHRVPSGTKVFMACDELMLDWVRHGCERDAESDTAR